jgi:hypothetical protein
MHTVAAGVCLGGALLSKGPAPVLTVLVPLMVWLAIYHRRRGVWLAVGGAVVVGILTFAPWVIAVAVRHPEAWAFWKGEFFKLSTSRDPHAVTVLLDTGRPWYYYVQAFIWAAPFVPLFVAGLCLPFFKPRDDAERSLRRGRWLAWGVTVGGLVLLSIPSVKELRYAVQLLPFVALVCGTAAQQVVRTVDRKDAGAWATAFGQALFFWVPGAVGIVAAVWVIVAGRLPIQAALSPILAMGPWMFLVVSALLLVAGAFAWTWYVRRELFRAGAAFVLASWFFAIVVNWSNRADPANHTNDFRAAAEQAAKVVGRAPVAVFRPQDIPPWLATAYYFDRVVPQLIVEWVVKLSGEHPGEAVYVMEWAPVEQEESWQLKAVEQLTKRKSARVYTWEGEGRRLTVTRLEVPVLLIGEGGKKSQ